MGSVLLFFNKFLIDDVVANFGRDILQKYKRLIQRLNPNSKSLKAFYKIVLELPEGAN